ASRHARPSPIPPRAYLQPVSSFALILPRKRCCPANLNSHNIRSQSLLHCKCGKTIANQRTVPEDSSAQALVLTPPEKILLAKVRLERLRPGTIYISLQPPAQQASGHAPM